MIHELLRGGAKASSSRLLATAPTRTYTYFEGYKIALGLSNAITRRGIHRIACYVQDSPDLVVLLCACSMTGCEVSVFNREYTADEIAALIERFNFSTLVVDTKLAIPSVRTVELSELLADADRETKTDVEQILTIQDSPLMILTTGTTGSPKGVRYTWSSLVAQAKRKPDLSGSRWLLAYHLNHFAGIQMLVHILLNQASLVIPGSSGITDAIQAMKNFHVEYVSATPTFWRLLIAQLTSEEARELPIRQVTLGGEAVSESLLAALEDYFPSACISQVFAATEVGSCFSVRDRKKGIPRSLLDRDEDAEVQIKIVDGELYVRSKYGMLGYYGEPESGEPVWRATGDLVEIRDDRIYFVGRKSETINVGGVKVHPLPIEELVQRVPGVTLAHAYGKPNPVTGQIVALDAVPDKEVDLSKLEADIRSACQTLSRHSRPRIIRFVQALDTVNRKVLRRPS